MSPSDETSPTPRGLPRRLAGWATLILVIPPASGAEAQVFSYQQGGNRYLEYSFTNNDPSTEYHSAEFDLAASIGTLLDFNQNGLIDDDERLELVPWAPAETGFVGILNNLNHFPAPVPRVRLAAPPDADGDG